MKRCSNCIMDTSDPTIYFDENGVCNHCKDFVIKKIKFGYDAEKSPKLLENIISKIKKYGKYRKYDCILGLSGGVDSSYMLHFAKSLGLKILAVHVDAGWNSEIAVSNIQKLCDKLDTELHTVVVDWPTMKELQRAYMFSGLPNLDVPQDHVFNAILYKYAMSNNIRYILNGDNVSTEGILPKSWGYTASDYVNIKDVFKKNKRKGNLNKYPHLGLFSFYYHQFKIKKIQLLNYIHYSKENAINFLSDKYDWKYYGGKHFESRFTRFFQSYYLPLKFGFNKMLAHLSSLVVGGEMSREFALNYYLNHQQIDNDDYRNQKEFILKKLDISEKEWEIILKNPNKNEDYYKNNKKTIFFLKKVYSFYKRIFTGAK